MDLDVRNANLTVFSKRLNNLDVWHIWHTFTFNARQMLITFWDSDNGNDGLYLCQCENSTLHHEKLPYKVNHSCHINHVV